MCYWTVPFYDNLNDKVSVVVWNNKDDNPINVNFIINGERIITLNNVNKFEWKIRDVGNINEIDSILILVNDKIKTKIEFNNESREWFKRTNYTLFSNK